MKHEDIKLDKKIVKKAVSMHDKQQHGGKKTNLKALKKGGVAKTVTKEMEYDYKTGKKSFAGSTAKRDAHAEKEGKRVAKDLAYDKAKKYESGGIVKTLKDMFKSAPEAPKGKGKAVSITKETITASPDAIPSDIMDTLQTRKNEKAFKDYEKRRESGEDYKKGGSVKKFARGGGCEVRGKTRGRIV